jgi:hypothetical protein
MTTSGTVGQTVITVQQLIDHGARRAGKLAEELTDEQVLSAKDSLYYLLSNLANRGIQYWCIVKNIIGLKANEYIYYLPIGTVDVLNSNYRTVTLITAGAYSTSGTTAYAFDGVGQNICQLTTNTGAIGVVPGAASPFYMATIGILPAITGTVTVQLQYSYDGITWVTVYSPGAVQWTAGQWLYYDLDPSATAGYWRILQTAGPNMGVYQVQFGTAPIEIPLARMNRDDYVNLPNKNFLSTRPLQYWFDRNIPQPAMYLWPTSNTIQPQIVAWCHRQIQDVGSLQGSLEIPQRWYLAIQNMLAHQMALELPEVDPNRITMIKAEANETWLQAEQEERDKSPIYFAPNISPYTK